MDNLTHTLVGLGLARAGLAQRFGRGTTPLLIAASNLPDLDVVCLAAGPLGFLGRRTLTHSVLGVTLLTLGTAFLFKRLYPNLSWRALGGLSLLGTAGHVVLDLLNAYGVLLLYPFSGERFSWSLLFIIDLAVWGLLLAALALGWPRGMPRRLIWRMGLSALACYIGLVGYAKARSQTQLLEVLRQDGVSAEAVYLYPEPFGPQRFRGVARAGGVYHTYLLFPFQGRTRDLGSLTVSIDSPIVRAARRTRAGRRLEAFYLTPVWRLAPGGQEALVRGLGFESAVLNRQMSPFIFAVSPQGRVRRASLQPQ